MENNKKEIDNIIYKNENFIFKFFSITKFNENKIT